MARVTVEGCEDKVSSPFELVVLAAHRAKQIAAGSPITVEQNNDKKTVIALREIEHETVSVDAIKASLIDLHRQYVQNEPQEEEMDDLLEQEISSVQHIAEQHFIGGQPQSSHLSDEDADDDADDQLDIEEDLHEIDDEAQSDPQDLDSNIEEDNTSEL